MSTMARVLVSERSGGRAAGIGAILADSGCAVTNVAALDDVPFRAARDRPDVVVLDGGQPKAARQRVAHALRRDATTKLIPVIVAGAAEAGERSSGLDTVLPRPFSNGDLVARVHALRRLATMRQELERRVETAAMFGFSSVVDADLAQGPSRVRVVAIDPSDGDLAVLRAGFAQGGSIEIVGGPDAIPALSGTGRDAAIVFAGRDGAAPLEVCDVVRRVPNLFHFPVIVVAEPATFKDPAEPYRHGASDVVPRPIDAGVLHSRVQALVRQERFRSFLQSAYREGLGTVVTDGLTGLYRFGFAHQHLAAQIRDAAATQRPLAVGVIRVLDMAAVNRAAGYASGDRALRQFGAMIGRLVRTEDVAARIGGATFGVAMPDTPLESARAVCRRILGVIANTDVGLDDGVLDGLTIVVGCAEARTDESPAELFERAAATPL